METAPPGGTEQAKSGEQIKESVNVVYGFALREHLRDIAAGAPPAGLEESRQAAVDWGEKGLLGGRAAGNFIRERGGQQFQEAQERFRQARTPEEKLVWLQKIKYLNQVVEGYQQLAAARQIPGAKAEDMIPEVVQKPPPVKIISSVDADHLKIGNDTFRTSTVKTKLAEVIGQAGETAKLPLISSSSGLKTEYELTPQMLRELTEVLKPQQTSDALETNVGLKRELDEDSAATVNPDTKIIRYTSMDGKTNRTIERSASVAQQLPTERKDKPFLDLNKNLAALAEQGVGLWVVADGMGGTAAGDVASKTTLEWLGYSLARINVPTASPGQITDAIRSAVGEANTHVYRERQKLHNDMGSTLTGVIKVGETAYIPNVGDSRVYLLRQGEPLRKITKDHSLVQALVDQGQITEAEIRTHPQRNFILRNIGDKPDIQVDVFTERTKPGDQFIVCCDGLWELVQDAEIQRIASQDISESEKVRQLVELANKNGGDDNITVAIAKF